MPRLILHLIEYNSQEAAISHPSIKQSGLGYSVQWPDGTKAWFHRFWLRENCHCPQCTHPHAWERTVDLLAIPHDISPHSIEATLDGLKILWPDHGAPCDGSFFSWKWLSDNRTETDARRARKKQRTAWRAGDLDLSRYTVDFESAMKTDSGLLEFLENLDDVGVAIVKNMPDTHEAVLELSSHIFFVEESHFGRSFEVESKPDPENLAYTSHSLPPHNDLPSRTQIPGIQLLHCRKNDAVGGESIMVDALSIAERMRQEYPEYFNFLSETPVRFNSIADDWHVINRGKVIQLDEDGDVIGTRMHPALLGPVDVAPDDMDMFYRAHRTMMEMCVDPSMQLMFRLNAGECQVFDNYRIMHARKSFDPSTGARHLHGCYVTSDDMRSRLEVLRRKGADFRET